MSEFTMNYNSESDNYSTDYNTSVMSFQTDLNVSDASIPATKTTLGSVIVGDDLNITVTGVLSVDKSEEVTKDDTRPVTSDAVYKVKPSVKDGALYIGDTKTDIGEMKLTVTDDFKLQNGTLSLNKATEVEKDNTRPITAAAVYTVVGNIDAMLGTI